MSLRKRKRGSQDKWTLAEIRAGLEYYKELYGRYPSSREIDLFEYLPSSRSIQRTLGGLENVRTELGFDPEETNHTKGLRRSTIAKDTYSNAVKSEEQFYEYLISCIPEIRVHEHKILRPGHVCCDFFIYTTNSDGFAVDIFYAQDIFTLARVINIKVQRYKNLPYKIYFVLVNNTAIRQSEIDSVIVNKKNGWPSHIIVQTEELFKQILGNLKS